MKLRIKQAIPIPGDGDGVRHQTRIRESCIENVDRYELEGDGPIRTLDFPSPLAPEHFDIEPAPVKRRLLIAYTDGSRDFADNIGAAVLAVSKKCNVGRSFVDVYPTGINAKIFLGDKMVAEIKEAE